MVTAGSEPCSTRTLHLNLQFSGGVEMLFNGKRDHHVEISLSDAEKFTTAVLLDWIREKMLASCERPDLLITNGNVRPGILVLLNDTDWEIMDGLNAVLKDGDNVTFISTLHGG